jgi:hypothetical protein
MQIGATGDTTYHYYRTVDNGNAAFYFGTDNSAGSFFSAGAYGRVVYSEGAYPMVFYTNASERMRILSGGNVGIGTTSPVEKLTVNGGIVANGAFAGTASTGGSVILTYSSGLGALLSLDPTVAWKNLDIGSLQTTFSISGTERARIDSSGNFTIGGQSATRLEVNLTENDKVELNVVDSTNTARNLVFSTGDTEQARIPAAGGFQSKTTISVGDATPSTSGAGITFPATQSASSDANTLDDYEEGTWTPVLGGSGGTSGQTYSMQSGRYTKIGRQVICSFEVTLTAVGTVTSLATINGLPFGSTGTSTNLDAGSCLISFASGYAANQIYVAGYVIGNETRVWITGISAAGTTQSNITATNIWGNSSRISGTITYTAS